MAPYSHPEPQSISELLTSFRTRLHRYMGTLTNVLQEAILLLVITAIIAFLLVLFAKMMWHMYLLTYVGKNYSAMFPEQVRGFSAAARLNPAWVAGISTIGAFSICILLSIFFQFTHVARYLYHSRGLFGKILLWGIPMTAVVAIFLREYLNLTQWSVAYMVSLVPTLCIFTYCFKFSEKLIPEVGTVVERTVSVFRGVFNHLFKKSDQANEYVEEYDDEQ